MLDAMVQAGEAAFGDDDASTLLSATATFFELLTQGDCNGFID